MNKSRLGAMQRWSRATRFLPVAKRRKGALAKDRAGVTAIEYGLIAGIIGIAVLVLTAGVSSGLTGIFETLSTAFTS